MVARISSAFPGMFVAAVFLLLPWHVRAQKIFIPQMGGQGSVQNANLLQLEGHNGTATKINYTFNLHRTNIPRNGKDYFQPIHDEILYAAATQVFTINRDVYLIRTAVVTPIKTVGQSIAIPLNSLAPNSPLLKAINEFINLAEKQSGIAGQAHAVAVKQVTDKALDQQIEQIIRLSGARR